ncbi:MAG: VWA domain-containing protein [Chloroflexi bacterium]|nr:VWA domain-containing protein [Chloroflexota bacterium]
MVNLMRCRYCGLLQDEPRGVKVCAHCGGELVFEQPSTPSSYITAQLELDQITAPADQIVERHIIVTVRTPKQVPFQEAASVSMGRAPMGFHAVLDVSGSMRGEKLNAAMEGIRQAVHRLHTGDVFSLTTFASNVQCLLPPQTIEDAVRPEVERILARLQAGGQTALCGGLEAGIQAASSRPQEVNLVLLLSDGQANIGELDLEKVGERSYSARDQGITTSTIGVGGDYNEALMVEIATQGGGRFYHVLRAHQIMQFIAGELGEIAALAGRDVTLNLALPPGTGLQPFSSAYRVTGQSTIDLGDIPLDTELEVVIRLLLPAQQVGSRLSMDGQIAYQTPAGHTLTTSLNPVTLRFVQPGEFGVRDGAVAPIVERVIEQMKARGVLGRVRTGAVSGQVAAEQVAQRNLSELSRYAALLGEERAKELANEQRRLYEALHTAPASAKATAFQAFRQQRGTKDFDV